MQSVSQSFARDSLKNLRNFTEKRKMTLIRLINDYGTPCTISEQITFQDNPVVCYSKDSKQLCCWATE